VVNERLARWSVGLDLASASVLVWLASWGREAELTPEAHLYFFDRYSRLARYYGERGRVVKARRFEAKAEAHRIDDPLGGPPYAAAMAMPRPRRFVFTNAVSRNTFDGPHDAA
jgi:hypothetical protein